MGAQPKPRSGVASLSRQDLSCSVQVVCLVAFRRCFSLSLSAQHVFKLLNQVSRVQTASPSLFLKKWRFPQGRVF